MTAQATQPPDLPPRRPPARSAAVFAGASLLWILGTEGMLTWVVEDSTQATHLRFVSILLYIFLASALLFWVLPARTALPRVPVSNRNLRPAALVVAATILMTLAIATGSYQHQRKALHARAEAELAYLAKSLQGHLDLWLGERIRDARAVIEDPALRAYLKTRGGDPGAPSPALAARFKVLEEVYGYQAICLNTPEGVPLLRHHTSPLTPADETTLQTLTWNTPPRITWSQRDPESAPILSCMAVVTEDERILGRLVLHLDVEVLIREVLDGRPSFRDSAEAFLVFRSGDQVFHLSAPRATDASPRHVTPGQADQIGVKALDAPDGILAGVSPSGKPSIAAARRLSHLPWVLMVAMDPTEIDAQLDRIARLHAMLAASFLVLAGVAVFLWWRKNETMHHLERIQSEQARNALALQLRMLSLHANDMVLVIDSAGRIVEANDRASQAYGYTREQLLALQVKDLRVLDSQVDFSSQFQTVIQDGSIRFETLHVRKDGSFLPVEVSSRRFEQEGGLFVHSILRDITERREAENALRQSQERFYRLFDEALEGIAVIDASEGSLLECNQAFERLVGQPRRNLLGQKLVALLPTLDLERLDRPAREDGENGSETRTWDVQVPSPAGMVLEIRLKACPMAFGARRCIQLLFTDLTEIRRQEREREATVDLLRLLNAPGRVRDRIAQLTEFMQRWSQCAAAGIRLADGHDYPYFETRGFPAAFLQAENSLCAKDTEGRPILDANGDPLLECMCGNILRGRFDPSLPFFTPGGSFWTNSTSDLLASTSEDQRQARTRNRCNGMGYESVALIPLRSGQQTLGLMQFNDPARGKFTLALITFLEQAGHQMGMALAKLRTQEALQASEKRFRDISEAVGDFIWECDDSESLVFISGRVSEVLEYAPEEMIGTRLQDYACGPAPLLAGTGGLASQGFRDLEISMRSKSGRLVWIRMTRVARFDDQGEPNGFRGAGRDITAIKLEEDARRQADHRFRIVADHTYDWEYWHDEHGRFIYASPSCERITGHRPEDLPDMTAMRNLILPEDLPSFEAHAERSRQGHGGEEIQFRLRHRDGRIRWIAHVCSPIFEQDTYLGVRGSNRDITEQRMAQACLEESEKRLQRILKATQAGTWEWQIPAGEARYNERWADILGFTLAELHPLSIDTWLERIHPEDLASSRAAMQQHLAGETPYYEHECRMHHKEGHWVWVHDRGQITERLPDGTALVMAGTRVDITARRNADAILRTKEAELELALTSAGMGIWTWDIALDQRTCDPTASRLLGLDPSQSTLSFEQFLNLVVPEDQGALRETLSQVLAGDVLYESEYRVLWPDGTRHHLSSRARLMRDEEGVPLRLNGVIWDISDRKAAEDAVRESEARFQSLVDSAPDPIFVHIRGCFAYVNRATLILFHAATYDELLGKNVSDLIHPAYRVTLGQRILEVTEPDARLPAQEGMLLTLDGSPVDAEVNAVPIRFGDLAGTLVFVRDITDRKRLQDALVRSERLLREAQEVGRIGCYLLDIPSGHWESSSTLDEIFGIHAMYPRTVKGWLQLVAPEDRETLGQYLQEIINTRTRFDHDYRIIRHDDGEIRWVSGLGELEFDDTGTLVYMVGTIQDITSRKQAEQEIRLLNEHLEQRVKDRTAQLEAANQELEAFSYSVSHDLRAPLRGVDGFSQALLEDYGTLLPPEGQHFLERIRHGAQRMGQLIEDLLKLSRVGRADVERVPLDLSPMVTRILGELAQRDPHRRVALEIEPFCPATGDAHLMGIALENLLSNAWKFTGKVDQAVISFGKEDVDGETVYRVRDNGAGFDMTYAGKLFSAFQRLHNSQDYEGTGIGLAIVQRIIHRHGGRIWAESAPGQGATFRFTLPH